MPNDDAELMRRVGRGDEAAFRALVDQYAPYLHGIAATMTGNRSDAEDLVQEAFLAVLNSRFRGEAKVRTWLVQILVRRVAMLRRTRRRRPVESRAELAEQSAVNFGGPSAEGTSGTDSRLDLAVMLEQLSPEHRDVIVLREIEGMTYEEMAAALDVPRGTVESRLHRARNELRARFNGYLNG